VFRILEEFGSGLDENILEGYVRFLGVSRLQGRGIAARTCRDSGRVLKGQSLGFGVYK
jgi:hypothetical protein